MLIGPAVALAMLAQAAQAPQASGQGAAPTQSANPAATASDRCSPPSPDGSTIVICTQRPHGYRLNPDVMEAKREAHSAGRPVRQSTEGPPPDCATVGPAPCVTAGINLIAAALTAAEMAKRVATGQEIGSMFKTDPHPDEYQLYLMAKARREAEEAEQAAKAAKAKAAAATGAPPPAPEPARD